MAAQLRPLGAWAVGVTDSFLHTLLPPASLSHRRTELRISPGGGCGAGGAVMGPCACVMVRVLAGVKRLG